MERTEQGGKKMKKVRMMLCGVLAALMLAGCGGTGMGEYTLAEAGHPTARKTEDRVDISVLVGNIINEVALELEEKHITIIDSLKKGIQIKGNYSLLYSIFRNLMDNAIAYAGTNIQININCFREDENFYYFSFSDTGVGVPAEHLNRLFERFYRVDKGRSRKLGGTGLGLAIVKNAVIIHGGNISAKSSQSGGLEFVFTLGKEK